MSDDRAQRSHEVFGQRLHSGLAMQVLAVFNTQLELTTKDAAVEGEVMSPLSGGTVN